MNETNNTTIDLHNNISTGIFEMKVETTTVITLVTLVMMAILAVIGLTRLFDLLIFGNETLSKANIEANQGIFNLGISLYYVILVLDIILSWTFYLIYRNFNNTTAKLIGSSRFLYSMVNLVAVSLLVMLQTDLYQYITLIAFGFFIIHLFLLGYGSLQSKIMHTWVGIMMLIGGLSYIILEYVEFILSGAIFEVLVNIALVPASLVEVILAIYLVVIRRKIKLSD